MRLQLIGRLALIATMGVSSMSCQYLNELRATQAKQRADSAMPYGHHFYTRHDYWRAAERYVYALTKDPTHAEAHFYLVNRYENQVDLARGDDKARLLDLAIDHYVSAVDLSTTLAMRELWMASLLAVFAPTKRTTRPLPN